MSTITKQEQARLDRVEEGMAMIEKAQQLAGHFPSEEDLDRARRVLTGQISVDEAEAEVDAKWQRRER